VISPLSLTQQIGAPGSLLWLVCCPEAPRYFSLDSQAESAQKTATVGANGEIFWILCGSAQ
jgi:hypothetical protein